MIYTRVYTDEYSKPRVFADIYKVAHTMTHSDPTEVTTQLDLILNAIAKNDAGECFTKIPVGSCLPVQTVTMLMNARPILNLVKIFTDSGLNANIGCNQGSGDVYVHIKLPNAEANQAFSLQDTKTVIVWTMLGLLPEAADIEKSHSEQEPTQPLLANSALRSFAKATAVGIVRVRTNLTEGTLRMVIEPFVRQVTKIKDGRLYSDTNTPLYSYGPMYPRLCGYDPLTHTYTTHQLTHTRSLLLQEIVTAFWAKLYTVRYFPDPQLKEEVSAFLTDYVDAGIKDTSAEFAPQKRSLALYLYGTAGVGKSTFVRLFVMGLRHIIQLYVDPSKVAAVVKVPLNSISPEKLHSILRVRGISDWSVERIVEQTVTKGGVVILHLEENPKDPLLQEQLFERIQQLLASVTHRYPEYASNVLYVFTSNYIAAPRISKLVREVTVRAPSHERQVQWCTQVLQDSVRRHDYGQNTTVTIEGRPPHVLDMRHLEKWRTSVGYLINSRLLHTLTNLHSPTHVCVRRGKLSGTLNIHLSERDTLLNQINIHTDDGFFYYAQEHASASATHSLALHTPTPTHTPSHTHTVSKEIAAKVHLVTEMVQNLYLHPGVVLVHEEDEDRRRDCVADIRSIVHSHFPQDKLHETEVVLHDETDGDKLYGDQSDAVLRGFPRFIDEVTNPIYHRTDEYVLVVAYVSVLGQFMIRELLESENSKTHRILIRKDRLLFIVCTTDNQPIQSQLESRSHVICEH